MSRALGDGDGDERRAVDEGLLLSELDEALREPPAELVAGAGRMDVQVRDLRASNRI